MHACSDTFRLTSGALLYSVPTVSEKIHQCFDAAMMEGEVSLRNGSALLLGVGGSGKTHFLAAFLKEAPPSIRESTPCAKKPVRAVAHCKAGVSDDHFVRITNDHYSDMLIVTAENLSPPTNSGATAKHPVKPEPKDNLNSLASSSSSSQKETTRQSTAAKVDASQREETWSVRRAMKWQYLSRMQAGARKKSDLNDKDLLDVDDTGGQPMFHEVLPVFIQNTMVGILTVKLNESLDSFPLVEFYTRGERIGEPFNSPFTHLDTLRHCMRVIRSTCDRDMCPKIAFVGTHKDREDECPQESREVKEETLRSIIPQEMEDNIIVYGESLLLAINVKTPGREDEKVISILREKAIAELRKLKPKKIPLRYIPLEMAFQRMANEQRKSVMSKKECFEVAATYNFTQESFEAALKYLHGLKLVFYYEEVLPNVVFIDAQAILDKITELVVHSLSLQAKSTSKLLGALKKFVKHGIVTAEILEQFSSHYVPKLFMREELISLFKHLRIMAEISKGEYLMPCLLRKQSIPRLVVDASSLVIPALLFFFGRDGPKLGIYCFLLASLITEAKWELLEEDGYPVQVSRNSAQFVVPGRNPGCITIVDSFSSYFHISIDFPASVSRERAQEICKEVCPTIRETVLTGIRKASQRLNYHDSIPSIAFPCSGHKNMPFHPATISDNGKLLTCTTHPATVCSEMTKQHRLWLGTANSSLNPRNPGKIETVYSLFLDLEVVDKQYSYPCMLLALQGATASGSERVKIQQLALIRWKDDQGQTQRFYLMDSIAYKWRRLGELLDLPFSQLESIAAEHRDKSEECCRAVLGQWLDNPPPDYPITWHGLLELLEDSRLGQVATELRSVLDKAKLW